MRLPPAALNFMNTMAFPDAHASSVPDRGGPARADAHSSANPELACGRFPTDVCSTGAASSQAVRSNRRDTPKRPKLFCSARGVGRSPRPDFGADNSTLNLEGAVRKVEEEALIGPKDQRHNRLPGHVAYWFAWSGYMGEIGEVAAPPG
ncbi:MAG: DUF3179 domain-containing protein [Rhodobacteraceae bacterium]|nr:DUF3179 domain-containing protein [Paracoccaceae bacterium]